ncbi:hypothetical protein MB02_12650 [Croceicoccus estronivorus]|uniref:CHRD domain-containing protein n=1 Tax=Croceicoccus estronivorus TaxID=1172626 RepID=UPI000830CFF5|nr:CHRD domain-containing protein [Croceicoccus estronivorus]OCC23029.1 hypothetical protein MB02_12650 [Croceicoccus estronivorus]
MTKKYLLACLTVGGAMATAFSAVPALAQDMVQLSATLDGASETAGGDADGSGAFFAEIDPDSGDLCFTLTVKDIADVTGAHVHVGAAGSDGDVVTPLNVTGEDGDECVALQHDVAKAIVADPSGYYVNVHNAEYPKGAIRGQLGKAAD